MGREQTFVNHTSLKWINHSMNDNIKKNILHLFKSNEGKNSSTAKYKNEVKSMQSGLHLFSRMYIACQATSGDINTLFEHENHYWPLSLAKII